MFNNMILPLQLFLKCVYSLSKINRPLIIQVILEYCVNQLLFGNTIKFIYIYIT